MIINNSVSCYGSKRWYKISLPW